MTDEKYKEITIRIKEETYNQIMEFVSFFKIRQEYNDKYKNLPTDIEHFTKAALHHYLESMRNLKSLDPVNNELLEDGIIKNNIGVIMKRYGLKQKELADIANIHKANISTMVTNKNQPSLDYFIRIWFALGCPPIEELLYRESK